MTSNASINQRLGVEIDRIFPPYHVPILEKEPAPTSHCRLCQHYQPQGRRGGNCQLLAVPVESTWKACILGLPLFCNA